MAPQLQRKSATSDMQYIGNQRRSTICVSKVIFHNYIYREFKIS